MKLLRAKWQRRVVILSLIVLGWFLLSETHFPLSGLILAAAFILLELLEWKSAQIDEDQVVFERMKSHKRILLADLRELHAEKISISAFRAKLREYPAELQDLLCDLEHFLSDEDIRRREPDYEKMQLSELERLIQLIEADAEPKEIRRVNFLTSS